MISNEVKNIFNLFFPKICVICKNYIKIDEHICKSCLSLCHTQKNPLFLSHNYSLASLFFYESSIRMIIIQAKFNQKEIFLLTLKNIIKNYINKNPDLNGIYKYKPSVITYIPTHWYSRGFRGYDIAEVFAQIISDHIGIKFECLLSFKKYKVRQSSIKNKQERLLSIKDAFYLNNQKKFYEKIIIVDDIITTGATLNEAMKTLRPIAGEVHGLSVAKTP